MKQALLVPLRSHNLGYLVFEAPKFLFLVIAYIYSANKWFLSYLLRKIMIPFSFYSQLVGEQMQIVQIFEKDYPDNKIIPFTYTSEYYDDVQMVKKAGDKGWGFNLGLGYAW